MDKGGIFGITVLYEPAKEHIENCLRNSFLLGNMVAVVNGSYTPLLDRLSDASNIFLICKDFNSGIAEATNDGIRHVLSSHEGCFIALLDQDTLLPNNYLKLVDIYAEKSDLLNIGILAPSYVNPKTKVKSVALNFERWSFSRRAVSEDLQLNSAPIASGSLFHSDLVSDVGLLEEKLFIDYVDVDFCFRILVRGYKNYVSSQVVMQHQLGDPKVFYFFGFVIKPTFHAPVRRYYIARNRLYVISKYGLRYPSLIAFEFLAISLDLFRIIFYENRKFEKIYKYFIGFRDFFLRRFGSF